MLFIKTSGALGAQRTEQLRMDASCASLLWQRSRSRRTSSNDVPPDNRIETAESVTYGQTRALTSSSRRLTAKGEKHNKYNKNNDILLQ